MLYKKKGFPEEGEIVLCTVKKILPTTVFVTVDEYDNKEGIIHISEIAPGRIRSIRDYISEGKRIICKILRVNTDRGSIDLSLRRATKSALIAKNQELKKEQMAEKVFEVFSQQMKKPVADLFKEYGEKMVADHGALHACFERALVEGESVFSRLGVDKTIAKKLAELIATRMKPPEVKMSQMIALKCKGSNGIDVIKSTIEKVLAAAKTKKYSVSVLYCGAPRYDIGVKANDYKTAERELTEITTAMIESIKKNGGEGDLIKK